jgi:pimeloyl-ACP methyl ester carboxylesterase
LIPRAALGRTGLLLYRRGLRRVLWHLWAPHRCFDEATFERTPQALGKPDFVDAVIHSHRVRLGLVEGDSAVAAIEQALRGQPSFAVPTVSLQGGEDGVFRPEISVAHQRLFTGPYVRRVIDRVGHNAPEEAPAAFAQVVLERVAATVGGAMRP